MLKILLYLTPNVMLYSLQARAAAAAARALAARVLHGLSHHSIVADHSRDTGRCGTHRRLTARIWLVHILVNVLLVLSHIRIGESFSTTPSLVDCSSHSPRVVNQMRSGGNFRARLPSKANHRRTPNRSQLYYCTNHMIQFLETRTCEFFASFCSHSISIPFVHPT